MEVYTDISGKTHEVISTTVSLTEDEKERIENEIVEQLYEIFTRK